MVSFTRFVDGLFFMFFFGWGGGIRLDVCFIYIINAIVIGEELASDEGIGWVNFALGKKVTSLSTVERL